MAAGQVAIWLNYDCSGTRDAYVHQLEQSLASHRSSKPSKLAVKRRMPLGVHEGYLLVKDHQGQFSSMFEVLKERR